MGERRETDYIIEKELNAKYTKHYEGAFAQGSGYLHIRGSYEEGLLCAGQDEEYMRMPANVTIEKPRHPRSKCGTYVPGITGIHPLLKEELVNLPNPLCVGITAEGIPLDMDTCEIRDYERRLCLTDGVLEREFVWDLGHGKSLACHYERYVSRTVRGLIVQKICLTGCGGDIAAELVSDIDEKVKTNGYQHFVRTEKHPVAGGCLVEIETDNKDCVRMVSKAAADGRYFEEKEGKAHIDCLIRAGESLAVQKFSLVSTSRDPEGFLGGEKLEQRIEALMDREEELRREHDRAWSDLWAQCRVEIEGDDRAQAAVNFSVYHLLRCGNDRDSRVAICAKGFAGEAYFGHFFWDTEIYMLPFFLYTQPRTARNLVKFRIRTLEGAKRNAAEYGYPGARYPWESSVSGEEQCPNWQYADHEVHVTADVAFGLWHYFENTGDMEFLREAAPVFVETAKYWMGRVTKGPDGSVHIKGVMGPDEYVCFCDDNAYTNYMTALSLYNTCLVLETLEASYPGTRERLGVDDSWCKDIRKTADQLMIHRDEKGVLQQCLHFDELEEPDFEHLWTDRSRPFGQFVSQERNYRIKALKQADVLMLFYLFGKAMGGESLEDNYNYYLPYTTHDSSLSSIIHAILCCRMGEPEEGYRFFQSAVGIDIDEERGGAAEGIHIANCGGIWQAVVFGFAGLSWSYESETPQFSPVLPKHWKKISFPLFYRGDKVRVTVTQEGVWLDGNRHE